MEEVQFYDEIEFETLGLEDTRDAVIFSFIAQKSLTHLDLSTCEYTMYLKSILTEEQCRKMFEPRRQILYTLHLDLPKNLERSLRTSTRNADDLPQYEAFHLGIVFICECVYTRNFEHYITKTIQLAENRIEKLIRYLQVIKLLKLNRCLRKSIFLFDNLILVPYPSCMNSILVIELAISLKFRNWIVMRESPVIVGFILYHALAMRYDILQMFERGQDPISCCIIYCTPGNISILLQYGTVIICEPFCYIKALRQAVGTRKTMRLLRKNVHRRRLILILQLSCYFLLNYRKGEGLLHIWRTIPDPYFTKKEILFHLGDVISSTNLNKIIEDYRLYIIEETVSIDGPVPRTLQQLCRVNIRSSLLRNFQLPFGIHQLRIPPILKDYLNLSH